MSSRKVRGITQPFPIKLFYTSGVSIILHNALIQNIFFLTQVIARLFGDNFIVSLLGRWKSYDVIGYDRPVGGLAYYVSPPQSITNLFSDPIHVVFYTVFTVISCAIFSRMWIDISGTSARDLARQLTEKEMVFKGMREESMMRYLNHYIPIAAACGGIAVALLSLVADMLGAIGSGSGILIAMTIIF